MNGHPDTDRVLAAIDGLLIPGRPDEDYDVSEDAMRWAPADEPDHPEGPAALADDDFGGVWLDEVQHWPPRRVLEPAPFQPAAAAGLVVLRSIRFGPPDVAGWWVQDEAFHHVPIRPCRLEPLTGYVAWSVTFDFADVSTEEVAALLWGANPHLTSLLDGTTAQPTVCPADTHGPVLAAVLPAVCNHHPPTVLTPRIRYTPDLAWRLHNARKRAAFAPDAPRAGPAARDRLRRRE